MKLRPIRFVTESTAAQVADGVAVLEFAAGEKPLTVDREAGVIRGVKIIGTTSKNGRRYPASVLEAAVARYEGAKVNVGHVKGKISQPREYADRLGRLQNVVATKEGLFGDLHFNPKHAVADQLAWDAEHNPGAVGLSHAAFVRFRKEQTEEVAEDVVRVVSVDLVGDPATTAGLFEEIQPTADEPTETPAFESIEALEAAYPDFVAAVAEAATQAVRVNVAAAIKALMASQLPYNAWDSGLLDAIIVVESAEAREELIAERLNLVKRLTPPTPPRPGAKPLAPPRQSGSGIKSTKEFAAALK